MAGPLSRRGRRPKCWSRHATNARGRSSRASSARAEQLAPLSSAQAAEAAIERRIGARQRLAGRGERGGEMTLGDRMGEPVEVARQRVGGASRPVRGEQWWRKLGV